MREAMGRGERVEEGVVLDALGQETTDPTAMFVDPIGALLPFAGHKGYAMCLMAELLGGVATGGRTIAPEHPRVEGAIYNSMLALVIDPAKTTGGLDPDSIATEAGYVADHVKVIAAGRRWYSSPAGGWGAKQVPLLFSHRDFLLLLNSRRRHRAPDTARSSSRVKWRTRRCACEPSTGFRSRREPGRI